MIKAAVISNSELCLPLLHYLKQQNIEPVFYLGLHDAAADVNSVLAFCGSNAIAVEIEEHPGQLFSWLESHKPDYCFVFCYKTLINVARLGALRQKVFNIHPGKLPQYRGPNPVFWQLKNGESKLGVTIHFINDRYDAGDVVWSREINNEAHLSHGLADFIFSNILVEGVQHIINTGIEELVKRREVQDENCAVTYKRPALQDVLINWQTMQAQDVVNLVKACNPWNKGAITMCNNMEVKITDAEVLDVTTGQPAGAIVAVKDGVWVACARNSIARVNYFNLNGIFVPARFAEKFGFAAGQRFASP